jgi:hypothetical protein
MNRRDDLLRAAIYRAHAAKGSPGFGDACRDVVDAWMLFPLVEAELAIERARARMERITAERAAEIPKLVELMRSTSPQERGHAA